MRSARRPFLIERRNIEPRRPKEKPRAVYVERKSIPPSGRLAREITRALRSSPYRFPQHWI